MVSQKEKKTDVILGSFNMKKITKCTIFLLIMGSKDSQIYAT